ncbi:MAG: hypothetical protein IJ048_11160 [Clostridia bacterium]|nr:hypothetical protein [Clostridia bacterium]
MKVIRRIILGLFLLYALSILAPMPVNNVIAGNLERQLRDCPLPPDTRLVDSASIAGRIYGNGNGMQWHGYLLLESDLSADELTEWYRERIAVGKDESIIVRRQETPYIVGEYQPLHQFKGFTGAEDFYQVCLGRDSIVGFEESHWESFLNGDLRGH